MGFCSGNSGDPIFTEDFGTGTTNNALPAGTTNYEYAGNDYPLDGLYTVSNGTFGNPFIWHEIEDHTPADANGKFLIVNAEANPGEFYRTEITGLCENTTYEFSAFLINLVRLSAAACGGNAIPINVRFEIRNGSDTNELAFGNTGNIEETANANWQEYGLVYNTGNQTSVILRIINNGAGGCGNDLAIDDIEFKTCGDDISVEDTSNSTSISVCSGVTPYSETLTATPDRSVFNSYAYQWQESANGTVWMDIAGENNQSLTISIPTAGYYRTKVAEVAANLNDSQCNSFSNEYQVIVTPSPAMPPIECWETATINPATCTWEVTGTQPIQPPLECWESALFNTTTCMWEVSGIQPLEPDQSTLECWETATFDPLLCDWVVSGTPPIEPDPSTLACWETTSYNTATCEWEVIGAQAVQPPIECWQTAAFNTATCMWDVSGTEPNEPDQATLECWETTNFNTATCEWEVLGTQPVQPPIECWQTVFFNDTTCIWDVSGIQPLEPKQSTLECWETTNFNTATCEWEIIGTEPVQTEQSTLECWETTNFNTATCEWDILGTEPAQPPLECWQTVTFNTTTCNWDIAGTEPIEPDPSTLECGETAIFNTATCAWEVSGSPTVQPNILCYETAVFNSATCIWDISGTQPAQPIIECYETATFNDASCLWGITGSQPEQPVLACGENAAFNTTSCAWDVSGSPTTPPDIACYETATFNDATCLWDITGSQPEQPILECGETAAFNTISCAWEISENPTTPPDIACYETATFNDATCSWDISGTQPEKPTLEYWETALFNPTSCSWNISGTPTIDTMEENLNLCVGSQLTLKAYTAIEMPSFLWNTVATTEEIIIEVAGVYSVEISNGVHTLETIIYNVSSPEVPSIKAVVSTGNDISITNTGQGNFLYSIDGLNFQQSNIFYDVEMGSYIIYVKDQDCNNVVSTEHFHFDIPKFFTPNNDGVNDTFNLSGIENYSTSQVSIFDRYGKLLKLSSNSAFEWDGTYSNQIMPSGAYWYRINIEGQKITGHITLKR